MKEKQYVLKTIVVIIFMILAQCVKFQVVHAKCIDNLFKVFGDTHETKQIPDIIEAKTPNPTYS